MTRSLQYKVKVMQAALEGDPVETRHRDYAPGCWVRVEQPDWNWSTYDYRVAAKDPAEEQRRRDIEVFRGVQPRLRDWEHAFLIGVGYGRRSSEKQLYQS